MTELKPCPFCGGVATQYKGDWYFIIDCVDCHARIKCPDEKSAVDNWNMRVENKDE